MAFIENNLTRAVFTLLEIKRYLEDAGDRSGDALWDCEAMLMSLEESEEGRAAMRKAMYHFDHR